ncbi:unnamed protein product, partial [Ectocarpus sp. 12 AP-2014]
EAGKICRHSAGCTAFPVMCPRPDASFATPTRLEGDAWKRAGGTRAALRWKYTWKSWRRRSQHPVPSLAMPPWQACSWVVWSRGARWTRSIIICGSGGRSCCWRHNATRKIRLLCVVFIFFALTWAKRASRCLCEERRCQLFDAKCTT